MFLIFYFFFFSSRRRHTRCALVTGVQTCALPILQVSVVSLASSVSQVENIQTRLVALRDRGQHRSPSHTGFGTDGMASSVTGPMSPAASTTGRSRTQSDSVVDFMGRLRSEARRVGNECVSPCTSRW